MRKTLREIRVANAARQKRWRDKHRLEQPILPVAVQPSTELVYVPIEEVELDEQTRKEYTTRAQQFGKRKTDSFNGPAAPSKAEALQTINEREIYSRLKELQLSRALRGQL